MKHIVIIGSGLGALGLAVRMAARRWRVTVCEQGETLGGKLNRWREQGYTFDTGPSLITMPWVFEETFAAAGAKLAEFVQFQRLDPIAHYVYPDGTRFDWSSRLPSLLETLRQLEPRDIDGFMRLLELGAQLYELSNETFLRRASSEPPDWRTFKALRHMPLRYGWGNYDKTVRAHLRSPHLIQLFNRYPTYVGSSPYQSPATLLVIPYIEYAFGGHYALGGLYRIAEGLVQVGRGLGVAYRTGTRVEGIERERGAVSAVRLAGGERIACDVACMNGDASHLDRLLNIPDASEAPQAERSLSGFLLLRGLKRDKPGLAHHTVYFSQSYEREFKALFDERSFPQDPTVYVNAPSRSDRSLVPGKGETLFVMANAAADASHWDAAQIDSARQSVLARLAASGLELEESEIAVEQVWTPRTMAARYAMPGGAIYGRHSHGFKRAFLRPGNRQGRGLYLVSGSGHPGGGTPMVLTSAKITSDLIAKYEHA
ncbi:phytoene desaturase [Planctomycetaceae bacterium]|nr:phytoene desaturase [Planctomycetaceae bacterium]